MRGVVRALSSLSSSSPSSLAATRAFSVSRPAQTRPSFMKTQGLRHRALGTTAGGGHGSANHVLSRTSAQAKPQFSWGAKPKKSASARAAAGGADIGSAKSICVAEGGEFVARASTALETIAKSFEELKHVNDDLEVSFEAGQRVFASLPSKDAFFTVTVDAERARLAFVSPISAIQIYAFDLNTERWVHAEDGHSLDGLLTRDVMRYAFGTPNFAL